MVFIFISLLCFTLHISSGTLKSNNGLNFTSTGVFRKTINKGAVSRSRFKSHKMLNLSMYYIIYMFNKKVTRWKFCGDTSNFKKIFLRFPPRKTSTIICRIVSIWPPHTTSFSVYIIFTAKRELRIRHKQMRTTQNHQKQRCESNIAVHTQLLSFPAEQNKKMIISPTTKSKEKRALRTAHGVEKSITLKACLARHTTLF
jgi:hypothetical protein